MWSIDIIDKKLDKYNDNRLINYTPIIPMNPIIIDESWYNKQHKELQNELKKEFNNMILDEIELPHKEFHENSIYWKFIYIYKQEYLFDKYENLFDDCYIIKLSDKELEELLSLCCQFSSKINYKLLEKDISCISNELYEKIDIQLQKCNIDNTGVFVKTSFKSGKHHIKLFPSYNVIDVLSNLIFSIQVVQSFLVDNCSIILRKWNNNIKSNNEFRVFIINKDVKCISQQKMELLLMEINKEQIIKSICDMWNNNKKKIIYNDCVIDCYIYDNIANIIEINSGSAWSTAGSALFNWQEIINMKNNTLRLFCI